MTNTSLGNESSDRNTDRTRNREE